MTCNTYSKSDSTRCDQVRSSPVCRAVWHDIRCIMQHEHWQCGLAVLTGDVGVCRPHVSGYCPPASSPTSTPYPPLPMTPKKSSSSVPAEMEWCLCGMSGPMSFKSELHIHVCFSILLFRWHVGLASTCAMCTMHPLVRAGTELMC